MEGKYGYYYSENGLLGILMNSGDFEDQDVWDVNDTKQNHDESELTKNPNARLLPSSPKTSIPTAQSPKTNDPKSTQSEASKMIHKKSSPPIKIPRNWSKINPNKGFSRNVSWIEDSNNCVNTNRYQCDEEEDDDGDFDSVVPPHEVIAKRLARNGISAFSVFEGVGRTLKGRDLSKIRDAILVKTGFFEQPY